ncbi:TadE-like protein [Rubripirellula amarantea]|uniref:TadE-like protein n=1 Tax=Rubripirellula amarantea TaxID=2527999 RepID=A0A5C5WI53_9BACT|nr:TadE family protein [Rubripirellula amarantea]TWT49741.1 TadE-like protein [Rubripirellula amarantea]
MNCNFVASQVRRPHHRTGAAAVEFAMAMLVLVVTVFGGIEITRVAMLRHSIDHAAYVASRAAIVPGASSAEVIDSAHAHLSKLGIVNGDVTVNPAVIGEDTSEVQVIVTIPVADNSFVLPRYVTGNLSGQSTLMTERSPMQMASTLPTPPPPPPADPPSEDPPSDDPPSGDPPSDDPPADDPPAEEPSPPPPPPPPPPML